MLIYIPTFELILETGEKAGKPEKVGVLTGQSHLASLIGGFII